MYPFDSRLKWWMRGPHGHFIAGVRHQLGAFEGKVGELLDHRLDAMRRLIKTRLVLMVFLSASLIGAIYGGVTQFTGSVAAADRFFAILTAIGSTFATVFGLLFLLATRTLQQARADAEVLLAIQASQGRLRSHRTSF